MEERKSANRSAHTQAIVDAMRNVAEGEVLTHEAIANATQLNKKASEPYVLSAVKIMLRVDRAFFGSVRGIGYKRLTPEGAIDSANRGIRRMMRKLASDPLMSKPMRDHAAALADPSFQASLRRDVRTKSPQP